MANSWAKDRAGFFYLGLGLWGLAAVFIGFSTTYIGPMAGGRFSAPVVVHLHGALALTWVAGFVIQTLLVRSGQSRLHRQVGVVGLPLAAAILISGLGTAIWAMERDLATIPTAPATLIGTLSSLSIFALFVGFAIVKRRQPDWHKRLMLLATIVVLWPAFFRFRHLMPGVPRPDIWLALVLADLPILAAAVRDRWLYGRVHPVWAVFGPILVAEQALEIFIFDHPGWLALGRSLHALLT